MKKLCYLLGVTLILLSCGIDDYIYLDPVDQINVNITLNTNATVRLPSQSSTYFKNYSIFYRIYVSGNSLEATIEEGMLSTVSSYLLSDYNAIKPYTNPETSTSTNVGTLFSNRKYYALDTSFSSGILTIDFAADPPTINGSPVKRSRDINDPVPADQYFRNQPDLYSSAYAARNSDVQQPSTSGSGQMYTYAAMYVVATGVNDSYSTIYSKPTFIGVFRLPG